MSAADGGFVFTKLQPGTYNLVVSMKGFEKNICTNQSRALHILEVLEEQRGRPIVDRPRSKCLEVELQSELNVAGTLRAVGVSVDNAQVGSEGTTRRVQNRRVRDVDELT